MTHEKDVKVKLTMVTKQYDLYKRKSDKVKALFKFSQKNVPHFWGLKGVDLEVYAGEAIGLIGIIQYIGWNNTTYHWRNVY